MVRTGKHWYFNGFCEQLKKKHKTKPNQQIHLTLQCKEKSNSKDQQGFGMPTFADDTPGGKQGKHLSDALDRIY